MFGGRHLRWVFGAILVLFTVVPVTVALVDRHHAARLDPNGRPVRLLRRLTGYFYRTQLIGLIGPILLTISTNGRKTTTYAIFYIAVVGSFYTVLAEWLVERGALTVNGAEFFTARSEVNAVDYAHYESQWSADVVNAAAPSIQSDVVREPYVRLFIPYQPPRHNAAVAQRCPGTPPLERRGTRFAPRTGVDGIVAYVPAAPLPRGENVLVVMPPPRRPGSSNRRAPEPYVIPFWL